MDSIYSRLAGCGFCLSPEYRTNATPSSCHGGFEVPPPVETDVYRFAAYLAQKFACTQILDFGCVPRTELSAITAGVPVIALGAQETAPAGAGHSAIGSQKVSSSTKLPDREVLRQSVVVCSDVIHRMIDPIPLLATLHEALRDAPVALITTPARDRITGAYDGGPPRNPQHVREWSLQEFATLLRTAGLNVAFIGLMRPGDNAERTTTLAILRGQQQGGLVSAPPDFRVLAVMCTYNEEDVIESSLRYLTGQGVEVHLVDNWSTDRTVERAMAFLGRGLVRISRFPADRPSSTYDWHPLLQHVEQLTHASGADWCIHYDADEIRESPWPQLSLREALYQVEREGFNAVDHTCVVFHPTAAQPDCRGDLLSFRWCEFGKRPGHFAQVKAWKRQDARIRLAESGGHSAEFPGSKVYPFKFLLRHYPIRSAEHGARKIFSDRQPRWNAAEREQRGWHIQYDHMQQGHNFLAEASRLLEFKSEDFYRDYLMERLSGLGVERS